MNSAFLCAVIYDSALGYKEQGGKHFLCSKKQGINHEVGRYRRGEWQRLVLLANEWEDPPAKVKTCPGKSEWGHKVGGL